MRPNFFIVGAPKAGTTSLYHYLAAHPEVFMSEVKEVNFFSCDHLEAQGLYYDAERVRSEEAYLEIFRGATPAHRAVGEASVSYLFYPGVAEKIKAFSPDARIVIQLRNPAERAWSHYEMDYRLGLVDITFKDILEKRVGVTEVPVDLYFQQYLSLGLYHDQVARYLDVFGSDAVHIILFDDLKQNSEGVYRKLSEFLGVDPEFMPEVGRHHNIGGLPRNRLIRNLYASKWVRRISRTVMPARIVDMIKAGIFRRNSYSTLSTSIRETLSEFYEDDVRRLAELIGRDLSAWYGGAR